MSSKLTPGIIVFPASNCEKDMAAILKEIFGLDPLFIWHMEMKVPPNISHVILPGGFSFGDYLRAGALAALSPIMGHVKKLAHDGWPILGVCNGFQILCEAKLLPGALLKNHHDRFICSIEPMTWFGAKKRNITPRNIRLPIAHREGRFYADEKTIDELAAKGHIALVYDEKNEAGNAKINGARQGIAGIIGGPNNNILGLMPHPERMIEENMESDGRLILEDFLFG